jgi:hypothetical protein
MTLANPPIVIKADIRQQKHIKKPIVTQNDEVILQIEVYENGVAFDLTGATTISLANERRDGQVVVTVGSAVANVATFSLGTNEVAVMGEVKAKAQFYDSSGRLSTLRFAYEVEKDPTGSGFIPSVDEKTLIEVVLNDGPLRIQEAIDAGVYANEAGDYALTQGDYVESQKPIIDTFTGEQTNLQSQINVLVVDGDSSPESAQARVGSDATIYPTLKARLDAEENKTTASLADNAISPEMYGLTDLEKVQNAVDFAIANGKMIRFSRFYNITGGTITINKPSTNRENLYLFGLGGGLIKNDSGYFFAGTSADMGDIVSAFMKYKSTNGAGSKVWDGNTLIRIYSSFDGYVAVDGIFNASARWAQTIKFYGSTITGGLGWAFEWGQSYDTLIDGCTIEHREHGIRNTALTGDPDNNTLRIVNNVIEGLSGKALELGSSFGVTIKGNYMEGNLGGYIDLANSVNYHNGLVIESNTVQQTPEQITNNVPAITLSHIGNNGVVSNGNVATGILYEIPNYPGTSGLIASSGDVSYTNKKFVGVTSRASELGNATVTTDSVSYGRTTIHSITTGALPFLAGEEKMVNIPMPTNFVLSNLDVVNVDLNGFTGSNEVLLKYVLKDTIYNNLTVRIKNESAGNQNIVANATILRIAP